MVTSALRTLYSARMLFTVSASSSLWQQVAFRVMLPLSVFWKPILKGLLFKRMPKASSSYILMSQRFQSTQNNQGEVKHSGHCNDLMASLPFPSLTLSMISEGSRSWILVPLCLMTQWSEEWIPAAISEYTLAKLLNCLDFHILRKPSNSIGASPLLATPKPGSPAPPPFGETSFLWSLTERALSSSKQWFCTFSLSHLGFDPRGVG